MPKANDRIGPYQIIHKLGEGGFGEVWLAQDFSASIPREVAVKTPLNSEVDLDALLQEATLWARATGHLNVLEFLAARVFNGQVVLVSEYAPDGSLKDWLRRHGGGAPSVEAAVEMTRGILAGLEHLHTRGITHRDIKPENVLLLGATPRLADFGISRVLKSTGKNTFIAGTPHYMAPEAFNRKRNQQADLWSVGVMLYQMLSGRLPFDGDDMAEIYGAILNEKPEPLPAAVPEWLRQVVTKTLNKDPERRYQSAQEMREALRQIERDIEAEIAERERREAERRRLEEEEHKRREEEARWREEERKRREEEARLREIERQRQIEEAARLKALQEELRRKEEELAKLKQVLPHEAVTVPIVSQPDEAVTKPIVRRAVVDERPIDQEKAAKESAAADGVRRETLRLALTFIAIIAIVLIPLLVHLLWNRENPEPDTPQPPLRAETMLYWLDLENAAGARVSGLDPLPAGERFRLHFSPAGGGYLYLIAPGEGEVLTTFVTKRRIEAGAEFRFPGEDNWINVGKGALFTVIFSPELLNEPSFLNEDGRRLTPEEQKALRDFRDRLALASPETKVSNDGVAVTAQNLSVGPLVFEIKVTRAAPEIAMVLVTGGSFLMGSLDTEPGRNSNEGPQDLITIRSFYIGKYEVTQAQWSAVMGGNPSYFKGDDLPVETVSWNEAKEFCRRLSEMTGAEYRLPTEAEWEYACRAKTNGAYAGDLDAMAWYDKNSDSRSHPVGQKQPNSLGLYDMHGNVKEWCEDDYHDSYENAPNNGSAWVNKPRRGSNRVLRGGSWFGDAMKCRSAERGYNSRVTDSSDWGFRLVRTAK